MFNPAKALPLQPSEEKKTRNLLALKKRFPGPTHPNIRLLARSGLNIAILDLPLHLLLHIAEYLARIRMPLPWLIMSAIFQLYPVLSAIERQQQEQESQRQLNSWFSTVWTQHRQLEGRCKLNGITSKEAAASTARDINELLRTLQNDTQKLISTSITESIKDLISPEKYNQCALIFLFCAREQQIIAVYWLMKTLFNQYGSGLTRAKAQPNSIEHFNSYVIVYIYVNFLTNYISRERYSHLTLHRISDSEQDRMREEIVWQYDNYLREAQKILKCYAPKLDGEVIYPIIQPSTDSNISTKIVILDKLLNQLNACYFTCGRTYTENLSDKHEYDAAHKQACIYLAFIQSLDTSFLDALTADDLKEKYNSCLYYANRCLFETHTPPHPSARFIPIALSL